MSEPSADVRARLIALRDHWRKQLDDFEAAPIRGPLPLSCDEAGMLSQCSDDLDVLIAGLPQDQDTKADTRAREG